MKLSEVTKKYLFVIEIAIMIGIVSNLGHPVTPAYLNQLGLPDKNFGYFFAMMNVGVLFTAPLWGALGDSKKRIYMLIFGLVFYAVGQILFGVFDTSFTILIARLISGIGTGAFAASALSYINKSDILTPIKGKATSSYIAFNIIGASIGSAIGGILGSVFDDNYSIVFYIQGASILMYGLFLFIFHNMDDEVKGSIRSKNPFNALKDIKKLNAWYIVYLSVLLVIGLSIVNNTKYLDKYFTDMGRTTLELGIFNLIVGVVTLLANVYLIPIIVKKLKPLAATLVFTMLCSITILITFLIPGFIGIYSFYFIYIICKTIVEPVSVVVLGSNKRVSTGIMMGVRQSFLSLGSIIGIIAAGYVYDFNKLFIFYLSAVLFLIGAIVLFFLNKNHEKHIDGGLVEEGVCHG